MHKFRLISATQWVFIFSTVTLLIAGCGNSREEEGKQENKPLPSVGVVTIKAQAQAIMTELPGRTVARMIAQIRPQVGGIIQKRFFTEGDNVQAGDLLYQIDPAPFRAAYESALANVKKSEANLLSLKSKAERYAELVKINAVSKQENDDVNASYNLGEADLSLTKAALETARINLGFTSIKAPISGRIDVSTVTPGALVTANQEIALTTIQQLDPIYVDITQSSSELLKLKRAFAKGDLAKVKKNEARIVVVLEDGSLHQQEGLLKFSGVTVNPTSGAVTLRAVVPNKDQLLLPGMYVRARVQEALNENAILVPQQSVSRNAQGEAVVWIVNKDNIVESRTLAADRSIGNQWIVEKGLIEGDRVIVEGIQKVKVGDQVKPEEVKPVAGSALKNGAQSAGPDASQASNISTRRTTPSSNNK
jgi:membrane fusion protein (multidrug efflux system)